MNKTLRFALPFLPLVTACSTSPISPAHSGREPASARNAEFWKDKGKYDFRPAVRANDNAKAYALDRKGLLMRLYGSSEGGMIACDGAERVDDWKLSVHESDTAIVYYITDGSLWILRNGKPSNQMNCPMQERVPLVGNRIVAQHEDKWMYGVTASKDNRILNWVLEQNGTFWAWDKNDRSVSVANIADVGANDCYGSKGRSHADKILFLRDEVGNIFSLDDNGARSREDGDYKSIDEFKHSPFVCQRVRSRR